MVSWGSTQGVWRLDGGWQRLACCRNRASGLFFSTEQETKQDRIAREEQAKAICGPCSVRIECLEFALDAQESHGVWGGLGEQERRRILARRAG